MNERFTEKASHALSECARIARSLGHTYIGSEHLLLSLLNTDMCEALRILSKHKVSASEYEKIMREYSGTGVESAVTAEDMTPRCRRILELSNSTAIRYGSRVIGTEHILLCILDERECIALKLLKGIGANVNAIRDEITSLLKSKSQEAMARSAEGTFLRQYGKNFTELAAMNKFDPVIGRDRETDRMIRILGRKSKNNPCLIGEAGVGKSAIVEGLAARIASGDVPLFLRGKNIISVDLTSMVAGAKYRGDFEERIKNIVKEATRDKSVILFIDEIHTIVGAGAAEGAIDASNILKPQLSRGEIQVIGATTFDEYRRYIEKDPALERRFQPVFVEEPDKEKTLEMLMGIKGRYEEYHGVVLGEDVVRECIELSTRFITDRYLPDKAIDVMDEVCTYVASGKGDNSDKIPKQSDNYEQNLSEKEKAVLARDFELAAEIKEKERESLPIVTDGEAYSIYPTVTTDDVKYIISEISGVDISKVRSVLDYEEIASRLARKVLGQRAAIQKAVNAIRRADTVFSRGDRPRATLLFLGESGVGKTALASAIAEELFHKKGALIRLDMSEYSEKHAVSKLIGAPPGYAGYDNGGALTEQVRKKPHSLILFDEIEKADREVQNLFLQIADYGFLTDSSGRRINFRNTVIIMTSNVMSKSALGHSRVGFLDGDNDSLLHAKDLSAYFSSEFVNRFDEIIKFNALNETVMAEIAECRLIEICDSVARRGIRMSFSDDLPILIAQKGASAGMGARAILRYIAGNIEIEVAEFIAANSGSYDIRVEYENGSFLVKSSDAVLSQKC